jgi:hypothetical protein
MEVHDGGIQGFFNRMQLGADIQKICCDGQVWGDYSISTHPGYRPEGIQ